MNQASEIKQFLLQQIPNHPSDIVKVSALHFGVSRTTIHRHLNSLIQTNAILKLGKTKQATYNLIAENNLTLKFNINKQLDEFTIVQRYFDKTLRKLPKTAYDICDYALTELINNAKDHSLGKKLVITSLWQPRFVQFEIIDDGIGIFQNLYTHLKLDNLREAILQITKGKVTTDPVNHTGEGLFFTSRAVNYIEIRSNGLMFIKDNRQNDWAITTVTTKKGTQVKFEIDINTNYELVNIFKHYQDENGLGFTKTDILVELSKFEWETLISRSQAKRITKGLDTFKTITLDFKNVRLVGQGFVDEVFRVFQNKHPDIKIEYVNANNDIEFMIKRSSSR